MGQRVTTLGSNEALEDYAKAIYALQRRADGPVSTSALADRLDVSAGAVTAMLKRLAASGLARYEPYHGVELTSAGERVNRPDFGSGVSALVFAPGGDSLAHSTQALVQGALQHWLGDLIRVQRVEVTSVDSRLDVFVEYQPLRATSTEQSRTLRISGGVPG